jgi:hypothetical protein
MACPSLGSAVGRYASVPDPRTLHNIPARYSIHLCNSKFHMKGILETPNYHRDDFKSYWVSRWFYRKWSG